MEVTPPVQCRRGAFYADLSETLSAGHQVAHAKTFVTCYFVSRRVSPNYHMDHTWNFLTNQRPKTVHLYDAKTACVGQEDKEGWYMHSR